MKKRLPYIVISIVSALVFWSVISQNEPPASLKIATFVQLSSFFIPLSLFIFSIFKIFLGSSIRSIPLTLALIILLIFKGLAYINIPAIILIVIFTLLFIFWPKKKKIEKDRMHTQIPKLSQLSKQS